MKFFHYQGRVILLGRIARPSCIHVMYIIIIICEGRAGYKLCKIMLSSSDSTMEVRGECICRCYVRKFHCILADDTSEVNSFTTSFDCQPGIVISLIIII